MDNTGINDSLRIYRDTDCRTSIRPRFSGAVWAKVVVDPAVLDEPNEKININLPQRITKRIDNQVSAAGETRSGQIAALSLNQGTRAMRTKISYKTTSGEEKSFIHDKQIFHTVSARIALAEFLNLKHLNMEEGASTELTKSKLEKAGIDPDSVEIIGYEHV
ncbi:type II toxin-antitoxin system HicB family antitoxin [Alcaligenes sp. A-TC2]|uniref:type II toxin-antitoxin system HicB family antitoxin n=1 Tax=Alcaligenes nematophilus TaxID=2994643 RepID=UPI002258759B|nr:type II toxin-antitoxin system HicB family antitoxin [Alcaligenes nematophilus]MCX5470488.1 type II toxin-antitoxin system HicB family antitoxin [Alcaligenes nematophilus]